MVPFQRVNSPSLRFFFGAPLWRCWYGRISKPTCVFLPSAMICTFFHPPRFSGKLAFICFKLVIIYPTWKNLRQLRQSHQTSRTIMLKHVSIIINSLFAFIESIMKPIMKPKIAIQWVEAHVGFTITHVGFTITHVGFTITHVGFTITHLGFTTCFQGFYGLSLTNLPRTWVLHGRIESPWNEPSRQHPARRFQPGATPSIIFGYTERNDKLIDALPTPHTVDGSEIPNNHLGWLKLKTL